MLEQWISDNLSQLLDFAVPPDLAKYVMQIENEHDLDEYLKTLLDYSNPKHKQFTVNLKKQKSSMYATKGKKKDIEEKYMNNKPSDKKKGKSIKSKDEKPLKEEKTKVDKKKTKFVNLNFIDGKSDEILLKGRHKCDCEAKQHRLINNCTNCGRIVCLQEGAGPCFFCGELVCLPEQRQILASNTKKADSLYNKLMNQKPNKNLEESLKCRDKLLEYEENSERQTKIIDDECDYFQASTNTWLSEEERQIMKKKEDEIMEMKHKSRLDRKVTLDFAGRKIVDEKDEFDINQDIMDSILDKAQRKEFIFPEAELIHRPVYIPQNTLSSNSSERSSDNNFRIQDKEYLEMSDDGQCLSMHQPYASLLVAGIKEHEGRTWYSSHRGRLWIASTSKSPNTEEIKAMENYYTVLKDENIKFPQHYPTSCLLGCVSVVDVLTQEDYRLKYPNGESESPFVFICDNFHQLPIRFPIQGKNKIYKLDEKIHRAAVNSLEKLLQK